MRLTAAFAASVLLAVIPSAPAFGDLVEECEGGSDGDDVVAGCESTPEPAPDDGDTPDPYPDCRTDPLTWAELNDYAFMDPNVQFGDGNRYYPENGQAMRELPDGSVESGFMRRECASNGIRWVGDPDPEPDPVEVSIDEARRRIPEPELDLSPGLDVGGVVNLGMWLAVSNDDPISVTASGRGTTVTATATLTETLWDMGDGTTFTCPEGGVPIDPSALDSTDEGPCGHTYASPSPAGAPYAITVTATWDVEWVATDGRSGTAAPVVVSDSFQYDVVEIQTVGRG